MYRRVLGLRRQHPWLVDAVVTTEQVTNAHVLVRARARAGEGALTLALNLADEPHALAEGSRVLAAEPAVSSGAVAPHGWAVLQG